MGHYTLAKGIKNTYFNFWLTYQQMSFFALGVYTLKLKKVLYLCLIWTKIKIARKSLYFILDRLKWLKNHLTQLSL
jgi:hypothetical protein